MVAESRVHKNYFSILIEPSYRMKKQRNGYITNCGKCEFEKLSLKNPPFSFTYFEEMAGFSIVKYKM